MESLLNKYKINRLSDSVAEFLGSIGNSPTNFTFCLEPILQQSLEPFHIKVLLLGYEDRCPWLASSMLVA